MAATSTITELVAGIPPTDDLARAHRKAALSWLAQTGDVYRRVKPGTPSPHLVSYFLLLDRQAGSVLLCDHRLSGLWLPTGGHVEPGEHPVETVRREVVEELGIPAVPDPIVTDRPFFLTVTDTVGPAADRHTDVSLWFALSGQVGQPLRPDEREFAQVRWWSVPELTADRTGRLEPHLLRALDALDLREPPSPAVDGVQALQHLDLAAGVLAAHQLRELHQLIQLLLALGRTQSQLGPGTTQAVSHGYPRFAPGGAGAIHHNMGRSVPPRPGC